MMARMMIVAILIGISAAPAWAQASGSAGSDESRGRLFVHFEGQAMSAKDSFDAVTGSSMLTGFGAGLEVHNVWRSVFIRGAASRLSKSGERVFVNNGDVFRLGVPLDITMTPIELGAGWRFNPRGSRGIVPYAGAGALFLKHREESDDDTETVNETFTGFSLFGGIEVPVWRKVSAGAEVGWRSAKVGDPGGAMAGFGENNLGGITFRVMGSYRF
jgi:opacity protein-like surface antigen